MVRYDEETAAEGRKYIDDRRGARRSGRGARTVGGAGGLGLGGLILFFLLQSCMGSGTSPAFDIQATDFDQTQPIDVGQSPTTVVGADPDAEIVEFMGALMADTQAFWDQEFADYGLTYEYTQMVLFSGSVSTGCGNATSAVGPFYCPAPGDNRVYIDLDFYDELRTRFGAPGDFAQAYVIAHEVGHHVQAVLGISDQVRQAQRENPSLANELSVRLELQADCYAGVWAHHANAEAGGIDLDPGDVEEGLRAAAAVGDDRIQAQSGMSVDPHTWTHGSAEARQDWFSQGFQTGNSDCDTFSVAARDVGL